MPNIVNLDELVPPDLEIQFRGETYTIPGDLDSETVMRLLQQYRRLLETVAAEEKDVDDVRAESQKLSDLVLEIFKRNRPDLERLPFGDKSMPLVINMLFRSIGLIEDAPEETEVPPTKARGSASRSPQKRQPGSAARPRKSQ